MQKVLLSIVLTSLSFIAFAQDREYKVKQNRIGKYATDLSLVVNPLLIDGSNDNIAAGYRGDFLLRLNTIMSFRGFYSGSYYNSAPTQESNQGATIYNGLPADGFKSFQEYGGLMSIYLFSDVYEGGSKLRLPAELRSGEKPNFIKLDEVNKMHQVGIRVGGGKFRNHLAEKELEFYGVDESKPVSDFSAISDLDNSLNKNYTNVSYDLVSAGVAYERVNHLVVEMKEGGAVRSKMSQWIVYADALYGMNMNFDDILIATDDAGTKVETVYNLNKYTEKAELGFRAGFEHNVTSKVGYSYGVEFGTRPGVGSFGQRSYVSAKIGVSFNFKTIKY